MNASQPAPGRPARGLLVVVALLSLAACSSDDGPAAPLDDPTATGRELVGEFVTVLQGGDPEQLDAFLSDSFQLMRSDGSVATKSEYLASPPQVGEATISDEVVVTQDGDVVVVRWSIDVDLTTDDGAAAPGFAPRLSTFHFEDGDWRVLSHANFAAIE
ncbi:MAG: nuclear transport factor 2 family protein [Actinomycetota bacterium]